MAINVDLDETGKVARRGGVTQVLSGACSSVWSRNGMTFVVHGGDLKRVAPDYSLTTIATSVGPRVAYGAVNGEVYWTDGSRCGVVGPAGARGWGVAVPGKLVPAITTGAMLEGRYEVTMTYVRSDGRESGAPASTFVDVPANGGLVFSSVPVSSDPLVVWKHIYVSEPNGKLPYLAARLRNSDTSATLRTVVSGMPVRTQFMGPAPAGIRVVYYNGRLYVAQGRFLMYSQPHEYELFDTRSGFIAFQSEVRTVAAVSDGLFVGTERETAFLDGEDPSTFVYTPKGSAGGVAGTESIVRADLVTKEGLGERTVMWHSTEGVMVGTKGGDLKNLTGGRFTFAKSRRGASLFKIREGTPQFLFSLFR